MTFRIEHDSPHEGTIADYHPLTVGEIADLLHASCAAKQHKSKDVYVVTVSDVQVRLLQGIAGMECPRPIDGPIAKRMNAFESFYVRWIEGVRGDEQIDEWTLRQFDLLINGGECVETDAPLVRRALAGTHS